MKLLFVLLTLIASSALANTLEEVQVAKDSIKPSILRAYDSTSIGIGFCDKDTGVRGNTENSEYCIVLGAQDRKTYTQLLNDFPHGTRVQGVSVAVYFMGRVAPQPRLSGGN